MAWQHLTRDWRWILGVGVLAALLIGGCQSTKRPPPRAIPQAYPKPYKVGTQWYQPVSHARGFEQKGIASWYGKKFHGRRTSNGERYNMYQMTAAHKLLPFDTRVRVHNLRNGRAVVVRINDRGPFVRDRIIDLSYAAAKELGMLSAGTARVKIVALGPSTTAGRKGSAARRPDNYFVGNFTFQVGAFRNRDYAERLKRQLARSHPNAHIVTFDNGRETIHRVRVGRCTTVKEAMAYEKVLIREGFLDAFAVAE